jgi:hypothetical protein
VIRKIAFSFLLFATLGFSRVNEKENLKKTVVATLKTAEEKPNGRLKMGNFSVIDK